ncbi:hypothetical protein D3C71_1558680 [compost metagenome]
MCWFCGEKKPPGKGRLLFAGEELVCADLTGRHDRPDSVNLFHLTSMKAHAHFTVDGQDFNVAATTAHEQFFDHLSPVSKLKGDVLARLYVGIRFNNDIPAIADGRLHAVAPYAQNVCVWVGGGMQDVAIPMPFGVRQFFVKAVFTKLRHTYYRN